MAEQQNLREDAIIGYEEQNKHSKYAWRKTFELE